MNFFLFIVNVEAEEGCLWNILVLPAEYSFFKDLCIWLVFVLYKALFRIICVDLHDIIYYSKTVKALEKCF